MKDHIQKILDKDSDLQFIEGKIAASDLRILWFDFRLQDHYWKPDGSRNDVAMTWADFRKFVKHQSREVFVKFGLFVSLNS